MGVHAHVKCKGDTTDKVFEICDINNSDAKPFVLLRCESSGVSRKVIAEVFVKTYVTCKKKAALEVVSNWGFTISATPRCFRLSRSRA